jgi:glycosyltransferase involved in cell wall biosynthesis
VVLQLSTGPTQSGKVCLLFRLDPFHSWRFLPDFVYQGFIPMRVLFVHPGKLHTNLYHALKALIAHNIDPLVLLPGEHHWQHEGLRIIARAPEAFSFHEARQLLVQTAPDLVVIRRSRGISRKILWACLWQMRPFVFYDQRPYLVLRFERTLKRIILHRKTIRITPVYGLPKHGNESDPSACYLPFPVDISIQANSRCWQPDNRLRLLCVAKLGQPRKNHFLLLEALESLAQQYDFSLTLVGNTNSWGRGGSEQYLKRLLSYPKTGAIGKFVNIVENVPYERMKNIYLQHDVCILPSSRESLGFAPVEAMGCGNAAIISDACGSAGYLHAAARQGFECGYIFADGQKESLAKTLEKFLCQPGHAKKLGMNALSWTRQNLGEEEFARKFIDMANRCGARLKST